MKYQHQRFRAAFWVYAFLLMFIGTGSVLAENPPFTLEACIETALKNNPGLETARQEKDVQALEQTVARAAFLPFLDITADYTRFQEAQRVVPAHANNQLGTFDEDILDAGLLLRLPIYQGGRRAAELKIAELSEQNAGAELAATRQDLILNVAAAFLKTLQLDEVIRSAKASLNALDAQKKTTQLRLDVGRAAPVDDMKIDVRLADIDQRLSSVKANRQVVLIQLARLMGLETAAASPLGPPLILSGRLEAETSPLPDLGAARTAAHAKRPEIQSRQLRLSQAEKQLAVARSGGLPQVDSFARYGLRSGIPVRQGTENDNEAAWAAGVLVDIPLFRGGAVKARTAQARIRIKQEKERLRDVMLKVDEDLQRAYTRLAESLDRLGVTEKSVTLARETFRIEEAKYKSGKITVNDVLDAQAAMLTAEVAYSQSVVDYLLARLGWQWARGESLSPAPMDTLSGSAPEGRNEG